MTAQISKPDMDTESRFSGNPLAIAWKNWVAQISHYRPCGNSARSVESIRSVESMIHKILAVLVLENGIAGVSVANGVRMPFAIRKR